MKLECGKVAPGCDHVVRAETEEEFMTKVAEHAREVHQIEPTPELVEKVKELIEFE